MSQHNVNVPFEGAGACSSGDARYLAMGFFAPCNVITSNYSLDPEVMAQGPDAIVDYVDAQFGQESSSRDEVGAHAVSVVRFCLNRMHDDGDFTPHFLRTELVDSIIVANPDANRLRVDSSFWEPMSGVPSDHARPGSGSASRPLVMWATKDAPPVSELIWSARNRVGLYVAARGVEKFVDARRKSYA